MTSRRLLVTVAVAFFGFGASPASAADRDASLVAKSGSEIVESGFTELINGKKVDRPVKNSGDMVAAAGCWYVTWSRWYNNIFGMRLVTYYQRMDWCGSSGRITSWSRNRYGTASAPGWAFKGNIGSQVTGGNGSSYVRSWTQGHFCLAEYFSCVQNKYPWIDMRVTPTGGVSGDTGG